MELRERLEREGIRLSRRYGQHLVLDPSLLQRMVDYAGVGGGDRVLEVGAGVGNLTLLLARRAGEVIAVERDPRLVSLLRRVLEEEGCGNVRILQGDVLRLPLPPFNKVVSNLPYSLSSELTFRLLERGFEVAVLMYQLEFARRLVAAPGSEDYGRLTVSAFYRVEVELLEEVPPSVFFPPPRVRSAVVRMRPRAPPLQGEGRGEVREGAQGPLPPSQAEGQERPLPLLHGALPPPPPGEAREEGGAGPPPPSRAGGGQGQGPPPPRARPPLRPAGGAGGLRGAPFPGSPEGLS
jgi:16S rRNA (adenine1518-N6/adenine1519-N6)-dimethyltransferase